MKFESKCGLGEIVLTRQGQRSDGKINQDIIGEVIAVTFQNGCDPIYTVRIGSSGITFGCTECELIGDPDFDQEAGYAHPA